MRFFLVLVTVAAATAVVLAQAPTSGGHHDGAAEPSDSHATAPMPQHQQMMQNMTAADQKLSELVATMNAAAGDTKVDAMAAVVRELVAQRKEMQQQMRMMQSGMMEQMMSRMSAMHGSGGMKNAPQSRKDAAEPDHADHHPDK
jgi:hypothetical protein